jgi:hypothetical protein
MYLHLFERATPQKEIEMNPPVPGFLPPLILFPSLITIAALLFGLNRSLKSANWPQPGRSQAVWGGAALLAIFYVAALIPGKSEFYRDPIGRIPTIPFGILLPIAAGILMFLGWRPLRRVVETVPQQWLVGVQLFRVEGVIFLTLYAAGLLPAQFALPAGIGDVLVGLLAPLVAIAYLRNSRHSNALVRAWNLLGIADLVVAVTTGFLTSPSPFQALALDKPNRLVGQYPLVMIPVFLVPLAFLLHFASLRKLRHAESLPQTGTPRLVSEHG